LRKTEIKKEETRNKKDVELVFKERQSKSGQSDKAILL
jgi:putative transposon-encoded protein